MQQASLREKTGLLGNLGMEVEVNGINPNWYAYQKARQLTRMNFNGGFRDLLNSNIGNDILYQDGLALCDFDTFHVVDIPRVPNKDFLRKFILQSFVEAVKSSLPIIDLTKDDSNATNSAYLTGSSL